VSSAPPQPYQALRLMLSAGMTRVAGALYAMMFGFVDPRIEALVSVSVRC